MLEVLTILWAHETEKYVIHFLHYLVKSTRVFLGRGNIEKFLCGKNVIRHVMQKNVMVSLIPGGWNNSDQCNYVCIFVLQKTNFTWLSRISSGISLAYHIFISSCLYFFMEIRIVFTLVWTVSGARNVFSNACLSRVPLL